MKRILTTHCGSLPRATELSNLLLRHEAGKVDQDALRNEMEKAVNFVIDAQLKAGIDIISDGEQPRVGFSMYVPLRMSGFGGESNRPLPKDLEDFPIFLDQLRVKRGRRNRIDTPPKAIGNSSMSASTKLNTNAVSSVAPCNDSPSPMLRDL